MTKRVLSLLLTLVMVLSLCVPALAAETFETEAPAEVNAAPVDPVAEDAPEAAAITEAVDVPEAAAYVVTVTDEAYQKLVQNITEAAADVAAVNAHTKMTLNSVEDTAIDNIVKQLDKDPGRNGADGKDPLIVAYDAAVLLRDQINGQAATKTDVDVENTINTLRLARQNLSSETKIKLEPADIKRIVKSAADGGLWFNAFTGESKWFIDNPEVMDSMELVRRPDYVQKLIAAVAAAERYTEDAPDKQPVKALWDAIEDLWELRVGKKAETDAKTPTDAEAAELKALYDATKAKFDDKKNYVAATTTATKDWINGDGTTACANVETGLGIIGALFDKTHTNQFVTDTSYFNYARAMKNIKLLDKNIKAKDTLIDFNGYAVDSTRTRIDVYLSMEPVTGKIDNNVYQLFSLEKNNLVEVPITSVGTSGNINSSNFNATTHELQVSNAWQSTTALKEGDKVTFNLYKIVDGKKELVKSLVVDDIDENYSGPKFRTDATYVTTSGATQFSVKGYLTSAAAPTAFEIALTADGKDPVKLPNTTNGTVNANDFTFNATAVGKVVTNAGDYKLTLKTQMSGETGLIPRDEVNVTVPALEKYKATTPIEAPLKATVANVRKMAGVTGTTYDGSAINGIDDLQTFVTPVKGLPESLVLLKANGGEYVESLATAKALLATAVSDAEKVISDASTLAYNAANVKKVTDAATALQKVLGYLAEGADTTAFDTALAAAQALVKSDYTTNSWLLSGIEAAITAAEKLAKDHETYGFVDDAATRADLKAKTKALNDAMDKLVAVGANKTALNAAIAAAEALKEADYTAESWKDADLATAIAAAKLIAAKDNAGQTEIDAAIAALNAATAKLVKKEEQKPAEGPKAPASGTGWVLYNGDWYFFSKGNMVKNYWVGQADGASKWSTNWYYVGSDGKMATGMQYASDSHGGYGWYYLQETNKNGEIGKMLTGWQWVGGNYGECWFSKKNGESGKCTYSELLGAPAGATWGK